MADHRRHRRACWLALILVFSSRLGAREEAMQISTDPITRYLRISYPVPADAPDAVTVRCTFTPAGEATIPARVMPYLSETAYHLTPAATIKQWLTSGTLTERAAAGLRRAVVFQTYPEAERDGLVDGVFTVTLLDGERELARHGTPLRADHRDVVTLEDGSQVFQQTAVASGEPEGRQWRWVAAGAEGCSQGNALFGAAHPTEPLPHLTLPLDLRGWYAIFVAHAPTGGGLELRLTGDEAADRLGTHSGHEEIFWRWAKLDRQHLVLSGTQSYRQFNAASLDYVRLVPLTEAQVAELEAPYQGQRNKLVAGYFEPYSWAFHERLTSPLQHREPLQAYRQAEFEIVDIQAGRFGMKMVFETRQADQLLYSTIGDPISADTVPTTDNVGRMQQYTNMLDAELRYCRELGLTPHANFGASNCYPGTPLQGDISKEHPDWRRGSTLRYELPEVRAFVLGLYRETLEIGADAVSIDFCRYPEAIDIAETGNLFLRELRALLDEVGQARGRRLPLLVRFPAVGVRLAERFDYATWVDERLVDILCPSNIQGRHQNYEVGPYLAAVAGTEVTLLPVVDALSWGPDLPGPFLQRVRDLYQAGAPGIYVYQADGRLYSWPSYRRMFRLLGSRERVERWWEQESRERPLRSKGIYLEGPASHDGRWYSWARLRFWLEGIEAGEVEIWLDGKLNNTAAGPPYLLGTEGNETDRLLTPGEHEVKVRARDGDGWFEQSFTITAA